jgi:putative FmdB family regulatory protein
MPRYEFMCQECEKEFELTMTISERGKGEVKCPTCKGTKGVPLLASFTDADVKEELSVVRADPKVSPTERNGRAQTGEADGDQHEERRARRAQPTSLKASPADTPGVGHGESGLRACACRARKGRRGGEVIARHHGVTAAHAYWGRPGT